MAFGGIELGLLCLLSALREILAYLGKALLFPNMVDANYSVGSTRFERHENSKISCPA